MVTSSNEKCPRCGTSPCYLPMLFGRIECSNKTCENYSAERFPPTPPVSSSSVEETNPFFYEEEDGDENALEEEDTSPKYLWSNYHHDFGDI